jgi:hypothetical protein
MKTLMDLEKNDCRYPVSEDARGHLFCAEPRRDEKCPYCAKCAAIAFTGLLALAPRGHGRFTPDLRPGRVRLLHREDRL